jgi:hypothetical protein
MATEREYQERIASYDGPRLLDLWEKIKAGDTPDWDPGKAFEYLILRAFQLEGADVLWPYSVIDASGEVIEQIDGVIFAEGLSCLVEAKDHEQKLDIQPIAKLRNQLLRRPAVALGIVFSRSGFTEPAHTLARYLAPQTILLWEGTEIEAALHKKIMRRGLLAKYRYAITHGWPDLDINDLE